MNRCPTIPFPMTTTRFLPSALTFSVVVERCARELIDGDGTWKDSTTLHDTKRARQHADLLIMFGSGLCFAR